jgi:hypothetical protein
MAALAPSCAPSQFLSNPPPSRRPSRVNRRQLKNEPLLSRQLLSPRMAIVDRDRASARARSDVSDEASHARMQRLLSGSQAALRHALAFRHMGALHRIALRHSHFNANQPRVPAGNPDGGQWTTADSGRGNDARVMSDATPDNDWKPGRQIRDQAPWARLRTGGGAWAGRAFGCG